MKLNYTLECRNGYYENIQIKFEANNILDAKEMATGWLKQNFIRIGWLTTPTGRQFPLLW